MTDISRADRPVPLSVVMPAYNEEGAIEDAVRDVQEHVLAHVPNAELVVVNDGSRDRTGLILDGLASQDGRLHVVHRVNGGHGPALRTGLDAARGEHLLLIDSDRQIVLDGFDSLWPEAQQRDGLFGVRRRRYDPPARLVLTRLVRVALRLLLGVTLRDTNVPFKVIRRAAWERARPLIPPDTLAPSLFLAVVMYRHGASIVEREVVHRERETGIGSLRYGKLFRFCARGFSQLLALRRDLRRLAPKGAPEAVGTG